MRLKENEKDRELIGVIAKYQKMYRLTQQDISNAMGINLRTLQRRLADPKTLTIKDVRELSKRCNIPREEFLKGL